jgi:hypothetical protein
MVDDTLRCEDLLAYLSDYIDRELDEDLMAAAQVHLASCVNCKVVLDTTQKAIVLHRVRGVRTVPAAARARLFGDLQQIFLANKK